MVGRNTNMEAANPAIVVGALFSQLCGNAEAQTCADAGKQVFVNTLSTVKRYLDTVEVRLPSGVKGAP